MELNDVQKKAVQKWVAENKSLSDIQKLLREQFQMALTYLDVRFLVIDLGLQLQDKEVPKAAPSLKIVKPGEAGAEPEPEAGLGGGGLSLEVDRVVKAGALASGTVTFSDGVRASWMIDQMGRLALDASQKGYRPSQEDIQEFQVSLERELRKRGF